MLKVPLPISIEVLSLSNLIVIEGSTATLTTSIISLILDYNHYGIREAGVQFHIVQPFAKHGKLNIDSSKTSIGTSISTFNMLNILKNEVRIHRSHLTLHFILSSLIFNLKYVSCKCNFTINLQIVHQFKLFV
jgi:hypothetical protein